MLPVDILALKKEEAELYRLQSVVDSTVEDFVSKRHEIAQRKPGLSFMIEDILSDSRSRKRKTTVSEESPASPCSQCLSSSIDKGMFFSSIPNLQSEQHSSAFSRRPRQLFPSSTPVFLSSLSPASIPARFGYYSPPIASSPPFSFSNRTPDVFTFHPSDLNEHMQVNHFRQDSLARSPLYSPSAILDLSNYVPKPTTTRIPSQQVIALPSSTVECPGGRQIIWKHINRNPAKRKGGQIRFTNEQTSTLENTFAEHKYLSSTERKRLATSLRLSERQVKTWFQNRRAKWRRIKQDPSGQVSSSESEDCNPTEESPRPAKFQQFSNSDQSRLSAFKCLNDLPE